MTSFSLCMIVKNEEKILERCLKSLAPYMDEDYHSRHQGSSDAQKYTDKVYDFEWTKLQRCKNFCRIKTNKYIYTADADEYLDADNQKSLHS